MLLIVEWISVIMAIAELVVNHVLSTKIIDLSTKIMKRRLKQFLPKHKDSFAPMIVYSKNV